MNVLGLAWAAYIGEHPEGLCTAAACIFSLLINRDISSLEFAGFLLREYQQVGFQKDRHLPLKLFYPWDQQEKNEAYTELFWKSHSSAEKNVMLMTSKSSLDKIEF